MGVEIDLLASYPKTKRNVEGRLTSKTDEDRMVARQFGREFFDGDRRHGYGGFKYMPRFWLPVMPTFKSYWQLSAEASLLDVGCAKGFMLHELAGFIPGITVKGIDISQYAIENAIEDMKPHLQVANATHLPFPDKSFDVVTSINTVHNLELEDCGKALREIERVSKGKAFVTVDAYRNEDERSRMYAWNLTAKTIMSTDEWVAFFFDVGYSGDYYWFIP